MSRPTQWRLYRTSAMRQGRRRRTTSLSLKTRERVLENEESEKKSVRFQKRKSPQIKRPANVTLEKAKSKEARIKVKKEKMDEVITVKQEMVEETETLPKGWKSQREEKRFASMVAAVERMIRNSYTSDQIYQVWMGLGSEGWGLATSNTSLLLGAGGSNVWLRSSNIDTRECLH